AAAGHLHQRVVDLDLTEIENFSAAVRARHFQPLRDLVDRDDAAGSHHPGALDRELADWTTPPYRHRVALLDLGILGRHPSGRKDVGEEEHLFVRQAVGHPGWADIGRSDE